MSALGDSLTVGILLTLIFGAVCFYLYSRLGQTEKRLSLLETLLLSLKMSTEASLMGPDTVEPVSGPAPLNVDDVEVMDEEQQYAEMMKEIPTGSEAAEAAAEGDGEAQEEAALEQAAESIPAPAVPLRQMDANYESMSLKELSALARQRGISGVPSRKKELITALKRAGGGAGADDTAPLAPVQGDFEGAVAGESGFAVDLEKA